MKAYIVTTGAAFGLLTLAHIAGMSEEIPGRVPKTPSREPLIPCRRGHWANHDDAS